MKLIIVYWLTCALVLVAALDAVMRHDWFGVFGMLLAAVIIGTAAMEKFYQIVNKK